LKGKLIIIGAHHDVHFNGALDNANGVAIPLHLVKSLTEYYKVKRLNHSIIFISFTDEEFGKAYTIYDYLRGSFELTKKNTGL